MGASQRWAEVDQAFCVSQELSAVDSVDTYSILGLKAGETSDPKVPDNSGVRMGGGGSHGRVVLACHVRPWVPSLALNKSKQLDILHFNSKRQPGEGNLALDNIDAEGHWIGGDHTRDKD